MFVVVCKNVRGNVVVVLGPYPSEDEAWRKALDDMPDQHIANVMPVQKAA